MRQALTDCVNEFTRITGYESKSAATFVFTAASILMSGVYSLMAEQIAALKQWSVGRARRSTSSTSSTSERKLRKLGCEGRGIWLTLDSLF